jgi:hypothetical protein
MRKARRVSSKKAKPVTKAFKTRKRNTDALSQANYGGGGPATIKRRKKK